MAVSTLTHNKTDIRVAIASQLGTDFGTTTTKPAGNQGDFYELHVTDIVQLDSSSGILRDDTKRSNGSRVKTIDELFTTTAGGEFTIQVSGIATAETLPMLLYACIQDLAAEVDSDPYLKTLELDHATTQNTGGLPNYMLDVVLQDPASTEHMEASSCVVKSLQITSDPGSNAGRVSFTATLYTGFPVVRTGLTLTPASWVAPSVNYWIHQLCATKTVNSADVVVSKFDVTITNEATRHGYTDAGAPQMYSFGQPDVTGSIDVKYDANSMNTMDFWYASGASADFPIIMSWNAGTAYELTIDVNAVYTGNPHQRSDMGGTLYMTIPFEGRSVIAGAEAVEVKIADKINRGWIA